MKKSRNFKLRKPLPVDNQMLKFAKDDMAFKRQMLVEMREATKGNAAPMTMLNNLLMNLINALTAAISQPQQQFIPLTGAI